MIISNRFISGRNLRSFNIEFSKFQFTWLMPQGLITILGVHFYHLGYKKMPWVQIWQQGYICQIAAVNCIHNYHHTHAVAPLFQIEPTSLGFDLVSLFFENSSPFTAPAKNPLKSMTSEDFLHILCLLRGRIYVSWFDIIVPFHVSIATSNYV